MNLFHRCIRSSSAAERARQIAYGRSRQHHERDFPPALPAGPVARAHTLRRPFVVDPACKPGSRRAGLLAEQVRFARQQKVRQR